MSKRNKTKSISPALQYHQTPKPGKLEIRATKPLAKLDVKADRNTKKEGWQLVGTKGFSCIKCHTFGKFKATGVQSIDMSIMHKRLTRRSDPTLSIKQ